MMDESTRNLVIGSIILVLAAMYGGDTLGSWYLFTGESHSTDTSAGAEMSMNFVLEEVEAETKYISTDGNSDRDSESVDYDDNDCDCDEIEDLMQGQIKNLLYIAVLAGFASLYFMSQGANEDMAANACLAMAGASLLTTAMFALSFPNALDDDTEMFEDMGCDPDDRGEDPSFYGSEDCEDDSGTVEQEWNWRPGFAWVLVLLSGIMGMAAYADVKR
jgi:hypothetical protein